MANHPITDDDMCAMRARIARGEPCYMPVRVDTITSKGHVIINMLSWGSPLAYEFVPRNGQVYCLWRYRSGDDLLAEPDEMA